MPFSTTTRAGFIRLKLSGGFGTDTYPVALANWIKSRHGDAPTAPVLPTIELAHARLHRRAGSST